MSKFEGIENQNNGHYSEQTGHLLRGNHNYVVSKLGGVMPETVPGFKGIDVTKSQLIRRNMRRTPRDGRR